MSVRAPKSWELKLELGQLKPWQVTGSARRMPKTVMRKRKRKNTR